MMSRRGVAALPLSRRSRCVTIPTSRPCSSTTGRRWILCTYMVRRAVVLSVSGETVIAGLVIGHAQDLRRDDKRRRGGEALGVDGGSAVTDQWRNLAMIMFY